MPCPCITVHSLDHARAALDAAARAGVGITLLSAPGAAAYLGPGWFVQMLAQLGDAERAALEQAYLDCGPRPGDVLAGFRAGVPGVIFTGRGDVADKLRALAEANGVAFRTKRPEALDLLDARDPSRAVTAYLDGSANRGR
jgi:hypothetical protein